MDAARVHAGQLLVRPDDSTVTRPVHVGAQIADDRFTEAWCYFDCLDVWAQPPSLTTRVDDVVTVRVQQVELDSADRVWRVIPS
jgi:hypothetical protein